MSQLQSFPFLKKNINKTIALTVKEITGQTHPWIPDHLLTITKQFNTNRVCTVCRGSRTAVKHDSDYMSGNKKSAEYTLMYCPACLGTGEIFFKGDAQNPELRVL